ncbi:MAG: hypothetical protein KAS64_08885 [Spirochaetes bacterium]|nr:hypothetical protein [Spirochaetota bacterium]
MNKGRIKQIFMLFNFMIFLLILSVCNIKNPNVKSVFIPEHINKVYVFHFLNNTKIRDFPLKIYSEIETLLSLSNEVSVVSLPKQADAFVEGSIKRLFYQPMTYTSSGDPDRVRYYLEIDFSFKDIKKGKYLLKNEKVFVVRFINLFTPPIADRILTHDEMIKEISGKIVYLCRTGLRQDLNLMYGYENRVLIEDDGTLIGGEKKNYDTNNDGLDDRYQYLTNSDGLTNINK